MSGAPQPSIGPRGGLQAQPRITRAWRWSADGALLSAPVRCRREQWYLARGRLTVPDAVRSAEIVVRFLRGDAPVHQQCLYLSAVADGAPAHELLGWIQAPEQATHLQLHVVHPTHATLFDQVVLHAVAERDPQCHPLANVPRWSAYRPPFTLDRVVLPPSLAALALRLPDPHVEIVAPPRTVARMVDLIRGAACVLDPGWITRVGLELADLERLAAEAWLMVDLGTLARLVTRAHLAQTRVVAHTSPHEIMSARVEYADVPTRGFALQDAFPYCVLHGSESFQVRALKATRAWQRYADEVGFATLLASETPWVHEGGDVLSAARPVERGELIATDLPWLIAGQHGRLLAPRIAQHLLRMHLGGPIDDAVQHWNPWDDSDLLVRDIADFARRYPPLRPVRWASADDALVHLGVILPAAGGTPAPPPGSGALTSRSLLIRTGRIDNRGVHGGVAAEPLIVFMKWLAREARERTAWARLHLDQVSVAWQFDSAAGQRWAASYESAAGMIRGEPHAAVVLARHEHAAQVARQAGAQLEVMPITDDVGILGDGSVEYQASLTCRLRAWIEQHRG